LSRVKGGGGKESRKGKDKRKKMDWKRGGKGSKAKRWMERREVDK